MLLCHSWFKIPADYTDFLIGDHVFTEETIQVHNVHSRAPSIYLIHLLNNHMEKGTRLTHNLHWNMEAGMVEH